MTTRRISSWLRRSLLVLGLATFGLTLVSGCGDDDTEGDCESPEAHKACSRPQLLCGVGSCNIAWCSEQGKWCTAITPTPGCNAPTPAPGFCPASAPDDGTACAAENGTTCAYGCAGGTIYSACNDGVFCSVSTCKS